LVFVIGFRVRAFLEEELTHVGLVIHNRILFILVSYVTSYVYTYKDLPEVRIDHPAEHQMVRLRVAETSS
jgi:hypothetical protein